MNHDLTSDLSVPNHHADHAGFSGISGLLAAISMRGTRRGNAELAIELTGLSSGERVLDIGCGPGGAARSSAALGATVTGVDPARVMLLVARVDDWRRRVTWRVGGAEALPVPDASFDVAWALSTVHHWPDLDASLAELRRVLAPGGRFLATERRTRAGATGLASHGWTDAQAEAFGQMCTAAGFAEAEVSTHPFHRGQLHAVLAGMPSA